MSGRATLPATIIFAGCGRPGRASRTIRGSGQPSSAVGTQCGGSGQLEVMQAGGRRLRRRAACARPGRAESGREPLRDGLAHRLVHRHAALLGLLLERAPERVGLLHGLRDSRRARLVLLGATDLGLERRRPDLIPISGITNDRRRAPARGLMRARGPRESPGLFICGVRRRVRHRALGPRGVAPRRAAR